MSLPSKQFRKAAEFFLLHAGYATPPGRVACAVALAKAEERAQQVGLVFEWEWDESPDLSWLEEGQTVNEVLGCVCQDREGGTVLASLSGVCDPDRDYKRVIEAELASEAFASFISATWE